MALVTTLVAGISWVATTARGGIVEGVADRVFVAAVRGLRERLPALAGRPEGDDLARGVRQAQLHALERLILDYREQRPLAQLSGGSDPFSERALEFCRTAAAQPILLFHASGDALLALTPPLIEMDGLAAGAAALEYAVMAELASALDGMSMPDQFVDHLRNGGRGTPRFVELFGIYFTEQVKKDAAFREVLHTGLLLQNAANLAALGDWLAQVEDRFGGTLARLETGVADLAAENRAEFAAVREALEALAKQKGVPVEALRSILEKLGESVVEDGEILTRLAAKADEYLALREQISTLSKSTPSASTALSEGNQLLNAGDLDGARRLFADARAVLRATREQHARDEAALLAAEAGVDRLQVRYMEAASRYEEAERLVESFDPDSHFDYLCRRATVLQQHGDEFGDNATLVEAISTWRTAVEMRPRSNAPRQWAQIQNNLGNALSTLGERESGPALLEQAVAAYRAALEEFTRERAPLDWALTQNNLGSTLLILGTRESGTARLEEAVAAYLAALEEQTRERVPLDWAMTQTNLASALSRLGERERGTIRLEEAVVAYRAALEEYTRERVPLGWAMIQNNLGNALATLGGRSNDTARLEEAVSAYRAALEERTRERVPLDWAITKNNLGTVLQVLGERDSGTSRLEEAVAACRAALEERNRDRVPLDWAMTHNALGTALMRIGERESGTARLEEAVAAYRAALEERIRELVPLQWAITQNNLGTTLRILGERESGTARLEEAIAALSGAIETFDAAGADQYGAMARENLEQAQRLLNARVHD
ncbi:MAG TPA: tetratricopeptide repeat protein [Longimicrobium sp.]|nr:tetratricopeptide repeat protein [Longimicrobium sp.]